MISSPKLFKNINITTGLVFYLLGLITIASASIIISFQVFFNIHAETELKEKAESLSISLKESIKRPFWLYDFPTIIQTSDNFFKNNELNSLKIIDPATNKVIYENFTTNTKGLVTYSTDIVYNDEAIGVIKLGLSKYQYLKKNRSSTYFIIIIVSLISAVYILFTAIFINWYIKKPLKTLLKGIKSISRGEYSYLLPFFHQTEFNIISKAFSNMAGDIEKRETSLVSMNEQLISEIDERKKVESALRESEGKFKNFANTTSTAIVVYKDNKWIYANPAAEKISGFSADELKTMYIWDFVDEKYRSLVMNTSKKRIDKNEAVPGYEILINKKDNGQRWVYIEGNMIDYEGSPATILSISDITDRKNYEKRIENTKKFMENVINSMPSILICIDENFNIHLLNEKAEERFLIAERKLIGENIIKTIPHLKSEERLIKDAIEKGKITRKEKKPYEKGNETHYEDIVIYPLPVEEFKGAVIRIDDVTDSVRLNEIRVQAEAAIKSNEAKSQFLANISHEIRTPLNGIIGLTSVLMDTELNESQKDFIKTIQTSGDALLTIINDILDFSKIEANKLELEEESFNFINLIEEVSEIVAVNAAKKNVEIINDIDFSIPENLVGDANRIKQILINLSGNAVKFTDSGEVEIKAELEDRADLFFIVKISVRDTGIGISEQRLQDIFSPFEQADISYTRKYGGTGLGLTISKQLVELMNGKIQVWSKENQGSIFSFSIPLKKHEDINMPSIIIPSFEDKRVLIVDKNRSSRRVLKDMLCLMNFHVYDVESSRKAYDLMEHTFFADKSYDLVIAEMNMPEVNGYELLKKVKFFNSPSMVLMSMSPEIMLFKDIKGLHDIKYLKKPVHIHKLIELLNEIFHKKNTNIDPEQKLSSHESEKYEKNILVVEDNPVNQKVMSTFLKKLGINYDIASNGREAIEKLNSETDNYDMIFMDCQMPEMDGYEASRRIKNHECRICDIPIIAMTAHAMEEDRKKCFDSGMDDYLPKPLKLNDISKVIEKWSMIKG